MRTESVAEFLTCPERADPPDDQTGTGNLFGIETSAMTLPPMKIPTAHYTEGGRPKETKRVELHVSTPL